MDGPNEAVSVGARVADSLQGEKVFEKLHVVSLKMVKKLQPGLKLLTWVAMDSVFYGNEAKLKQKGISVIERWVCAGNLKTIFHCNVKPLALGICVGLYP